MNLTCNRCGIADARVLDIDTGSACHPELQHCIGALRAERDRLAAIVEKKMSLHWDIFACNCWLCEAGRAAGCAPRPEYLPHRAPPETYIGDSECPKEYWEKAAEDAKANGGEQE